MDLNSKKKFYRISDEEYGLIQKSLGREPQGLEWALFSALWSEHCSYKSSRRHLKKFAATLTEKAKNTMGENAGVVELGFGERIAFKMESHNHPSFIEPYQGAATGVGGILRDIFTMGARPIALANYICFGEQGSPRREELINGVVKGIGDYGNCVGVPTVTGSTEYSPKYNQNNLVNAMAVGYLGKDQKIALSSAKGIGNRVVYVGAKTGKDGVHGAAMASEAFAEDSEAKKPNVQIGDPFYEKLLIEACLEVLQSNEGLITAIQDMGAAGLTSSSFEMSAKGDVGMLLDLSKVPLRDQTMTPEEIMLSESQERMLMIVPPSNMRKVESIFHKWGLDAADIGEVTETKKVTLKWRGETVCEIDPKILVDRAPEYDRPYAPWVSKPKEKLTASPKQFGFYFEEAKEYFSSDFGRHKKFVYRQYDNRVGLRTAMGCANTLGFVQLPESQRGLSIAVGCRPWLMDMDAAIGAADAVLEPAIRMAIKGASAVAVTDCLNFGNPEKNQIMSEFVASVDAITEISRALSIPVVSGNVSFYNETSGVNITSTPAIGLIGIRENVINIPKDNLQSEGNTLFEVSCPMVEIECDNFAAKAFCGSLLGRKDELLGFIKVLVEIANNSKTRSSRLVGRGGLGHALVRHAWKVDESPSENQRSGFGVEIDSSLVASDLSREILYRVIFEIESDDEKDLVSINAPGVKVRKIGRIVKTPHIKLGKDSFPIPERS